MKTALEEKLHPDVSQVALRREFQHFRHLMPDYNEWLQFMHDEREGPRQQANSDTCWGVIVLAGVGLFLVAVLAFATYIAFQQV